MSKYFGRDFWLGLARGYLVPQNGENVGDKGYGSVGLLRRRDGGYPFQTSGG